MNIAEYIFLTTMAQEDGFYVKRFIYAIAVQKKKLSAKNAKTFFLMTEKCWKKTNFCAVFAVQKTIEKK